jgi:tRNA(Ile)-lysidine synthase
VVVCKPGLILRPFLETRAAEIRAWLEAIGQPWREDASNRDEAFTRNRVRHALLPELAQFNPRIAEQLAHMATLARDEQAWWDAELSRLLPGLVLPGKPVRGGGRAVATRPDEGSVGMELERLRALAPALRRRVLRAAAEQLGSAVNFEQTERLMAMCAPEGPRREELGAGLRAEKSARELRLARVSGPGQAAAAEEVELRIPGVATALGITLRARIAVGGDAAGNLPPAKLRGPRAGDRVQMRHSRGAKPLKEVFERMNVQAEARRTWPLLEWEGRIVWVKGVALEGVIPFAVETVDEGGDSR